MVMDVEREETNICDLIKGLEAGTCISCLKMLLKSWCLSLGRELIHCLVSGAN